MFDIVVTEVVELNIAYQNGCVDEWLFAFIEISQNQNFGLN